MSDIRPYYTPSAKTVDLVQAVVWSETRPDKPTDVVDDWSVGDPVRVEVTLDVDLEALPHDLAWQAGRAKAHVGYRCPQTRAQGVIDSLVCGDEVVLGGNITVDVDGLLELRVTLTPQEASSDDELSPVEPGVIFWEKRLRFHLGGSRSRFPLVSISFKDNGLPPEALWQVEADLTDLDAEATSSIQLLLNEDHRRLRELLSGEQGDLMSMLEWDIKRHVLELLLDDEDASLNDGSHTVGSIGSFAVNALLQCTGSGDLNAARARRRQNRSRFEAEIRGRTLYLGSTS